EDSPDDGQGHEAGGWAKLRTDDAASGDCLTRPAEGCIALCRKGQGLWLLRCRHARTNLFAKWLSKHLPRRTKGRLSANWLFGAYARVGAIGDRIFHSTGVFRVACCCGSHDQGMITSKLEGVGAVSFLTTANHRSAPTK